MSKKKKNKKYLDSYQKLIFKISLTPEEYTQIVEISKKEHTTPQLYINNLLHNIYFNKDVSSIFKKHLKKDIKNIEKKQETTRKKIKKDKKQYKILRF